MALRRTLRTALPALAAASALALTGCTGGSTANPSPSETANPATSTIDARPTPASSTEPARNIPVPELPEAAKQNTKEGFEAFVRHYISLLDYAYQTGDTEPALDHAGAGCTMCGTSAKSIDAATAAGGWIIGGRLTLSGFSTDGIPDANGLWTAEVELHQTETSNVSQSGSVSALAPAASATVLATAEYANGRWSMSDLGVPTEAHQ